MTMFNKKTETTEPLSALEKSAKACMPLLGDMVNGARAFEHNYLAFDGVIRSWPEVQRRWFNVCLQHARSAFHNACLAELGKVLPNIPKPYSQPGANFADKVEAIFVNLTKARATVEASVTGGGPGRARYRAIGQIGGISGGLNVANDDVIFLLVDDQEVKHLVATGVLVQVNPTGGMS
jgi:hypothetical protein